MLIIPAVDIKGGKCVRLIQGIRDRETVYSENPLAMAEKWQKLGAPLLHLIDLDGAFGMPLQTTIIKEIVANLPIPVQLGGGIRSLPIIENYLNMGVKRVILGTAAYQDQRLVREACRNFPGAIFAGIDARKGLVAIKGWEECTPLKASSLAVRLAAEGVAGIVYTDINRDGMMMGPNIPEIRNMANTVGIPVIASGGVTTLEDIKALKELEIEGVVGIIIGKALYTGDIDLTQAIAMKERNVG